MAEVESDQELQKSEYAGTLATQALELWKHFAATGVSDKNTMVSVVSWLLTFSATIIGYIVTQLFKSDSFAFIQPWKAFGLAALGAVISLVAGYVTLLYGGYANRNWARADGIRGKCDWGKLMPDPQEDRGKSFGLPRFTVGWSKDRDPYHKLAPVFWIFAWLNLFVLAVHLVFFIRSIFQILSRTFTS